MRLAAGRGWEGWEWKGTGWEERGGNGGGGLNQSPAYTLMTVTICDCALPCHLKQEGMQPRWPTRYAAFTTISNVSYSLFGFSNSFDIACD